MSTNLEINWDTASRILPVILEFYQMKRDKIDIDLFEAVEKVADAVGIDDPQAYIKTVIDIQLSYALNEKGSDKVANIISSLCNPVLECIFGYAKGDMKPRDLMDGLNDIFLKSLDGMEDALHAAVGFDIPDGILEVFKKYELSAITIYCFAAAYMIYRKAAEDADIARAHRIEVERLCNESIEKLKEQQVAMECLVNKYMLDRLEPFARGVSAMNQAIIDNDDDGYIEANKTIWEMLGRSTQYSNAEEFDILMLSDDSFKL